MPEGLCCGWPFNEVLVILVTTPSVACIGFEASAPLVLDYCSVIHVVSVQLSTSMQVYK